MRYYYAFVEGRNFILNVDNLNERVGFVTSFYFSTETDKCIVTELETLLKERIEKDVNNKLSKDKYFRSFVTINSLEELTSEDAKNNDTGGFGFYNMTILESIVACIQFKLFNFFSNKIKLKLDMK